MAISSVRRACAVLLLVVSAASAHAQTPPANPNDQAPNFRIEVVGLIAADFSARVSSYYELRRTLEQGLVALTVTDESGTIRVAEDALADRIRKARARARRGDIFTRDIGNELKRVLALEIDQPTLDLITDDNPGDFTDDINKTYPRSNPRSTMPPNILAVLPILPDNVEYRFIGGALILYDVKASLILDRLPNALRCPRCAK